MTFKICSRNLYDLNFPLIILQQSCVVTFNYSFIERVLIIQQYKGPAQ